MIKMNCHYLLISLIFVTSLAKSINNYASTSWIHRSYGKNNIKLLHVKRDGPFHTIHEFDVNTQFGLATDKEYVNRDNSDVIATDSQMNIVYILAKRYGITSPEVFALQLCEYFLGQYKQVEEVWVEVREHPWRRLEIDGKPHNHAFISSPEVTNSCIATQYRGGHMNLSSSLDGLQVLKTTGSSFANFVNDSYRTLPDMYDRILSTSISASWTYNSLEGIKFGDMRKRIQNSILDKFDKIISSSLQNLVYVTQKTILDELCLVNDVEITMTNRHYFSIDLSKFPVVGYAENDEVFLPSDDPFGVITAKLGRAEHMSNSTACY